MIAYFYASYYYHITNPRRLATCRSTSEATLEAARVVKYVGFETQVRKWCLERVP